jgi:hypothetical protein
MTLQRDVQTFCPAEDMMISSGWYELLLLQRLEFEVDVRRIAERVERLLGV